MPSVDRPIEQLYREAIDAMTPAERFGRSAAMFEWTRQQIGRQIVAERTAIGDDSLLAPHTLKLLIGLRMYESSPQVCEWIKDRLNRVSD